MQLTLTTTDPKEALAVLQFIAAKAPATVAKEDEDEDEEEKPAPKKRGRKSNAQKQAEAAAAAKAEEDEEAEESEDEDEEAEESEDEDEEAEESEDEDEEEKTKSAKKGLTLDKHIIPAFVAFADKHGRPKAGKVLAKFKAKSVRDLPPAKFAEVLAALKL